MFSLPTIHLHWLNSSPDFSVFLPATEDEIIKLISDCPNKQCGLDAIPTSLLKHCCHILAPVITRIVNLSLSTGQYAPNSSNLSSLLCCRNRHSIKRMFPNTGPFPTFPPYPKLSSVLSKSRLTDHLTQNTV